MNLCDEGHDEVCFAGRVCPACASIEDLTRDLDNAKAEAIDLQNTIDEYRTDLRAMAREAQQAQADVAKETIE